MKKILAFSASNSPTSINHQLILNVTNRITNHEVTILKLKEDDFPIYSILKEKDGFPDNVKLLFKMLRDNDALIISVNEYNANVGGFFKNILDWLSRLDRKFLQDRKILLMSTSPGKRGGASALEYCKNQFPRFGGEIVESFSLPQFYENFDSEKGAIVNEVFDLGVAEVLTSFVQEIKE